MLSLEYKLLRSSLASNTLVLSSESVTSSGRRIVNPLCSAKHFFSIESTKKAHLEQVALLGAGVEPSIHFYCPHRASTDNGCPPSIVGKLLARRGKTTWTTYQIVHLFLFPVTGPQTLAERINIVNLHLSIWATAGDHDPTTSSKLLFTLLHGNNVCQANTYF